METCKNCGASLFPGMVCCPACFERCGSDAGNASSSAVKSTQKKKPSAALIAAICVAGVLVIAAVLYFCGVFGA